MSLAVARLRLGLLVGFALVNLGCYRIREDGGVTTLTYAHDTLLGLTSACVVVGLAGTWLLWKLGLRGPARIFAIVAGLFAVVIVPDLWLDRVTISATVAEQRTGFWFMPVTNRIRYADVDWVEIRLVTTRGRRGVNYENRMWFIHRKDGSRRDINFGDLWEDNEVFIVSKLRGYGVQIR